MHYENLVEGDLEIFFHFLRSHQVSDWQSGPRFDFGWQCLTAGLSSLLSNSDDEACMEYSCYPAWTPRPEQQIECHQAMFEYLCTPP